MVKIWESFRRLPVAVQAWMVVLLMPINVATVFFIGETNALVISVLAIAGMAFNMPIMIRAGGMTSLMALPHLILWTPMVLLALITLFADVPSGYRVFLVLLIAIDTISLAFDVRDFAAWRNGDRAIA